MNREVAIKVLPADFAADTERQARFQREATLLDFGLARAMAGDPASSAGA